MSSSVTFATRASLFAIGFVVLFACFWSGVRKDVPYVPTPERIVHRMLDMAGTGPDDVVYDLGSGDGRIVIIATEAYGARKGVGVDIDPVRGRESRRNAQEAGVTDRVSFYEGDVFSFDLGSGDGRLAIAAVRDYGARGAVGIDVDFRRIRESRRHADAAGVGGRVRFIEGDLFTQDFGGASVVTVFMLPHVLEKLRPILLDRLAPGTRLVSQQFGLGEWAPDLTARDGRRDVFLWYVPARVEGNWRWREKEGGAARHASLVLSQRFQKAAGTLDVGGRSCEVRDGRLTARELAFDVVDGDACLGHFTGHVSDDRLVGTFAGREVVAERVD